MLEGMCDLGKIFFGDIIKTKVEEENKLKELDKITREGLPSEEILSEEDNWRKVWNDMMIREETF